MLEHLFGSKTRLRLLRLFFTHPETAYFVREMAREVKSQINAVRRELAHLVDAGIIEIVTPNVTLTSLEDAGANRRVWYRLCERSLYYDELRALLLKSESVGQRQFTDDLLKAFPEMQVLLLTGQFVRESEAPTDMLCVGDMDPKRLGRAIKKYEEDLGGPIRYTHFTSQEYHERQQVVDRFLFSLFEAPHILILGGVK